MPNVHPTAIVEPGAELADDVTIGPCCHVGANVSIGAGTKLVSHVVVTGRTTLGQRNTVWPFAVLGGDPQDLKFKGEDSRLIVGDDNDIREAVTIHKGTDNDQGLTRVGSHNLVMAYVHIGHDCVLGSHIVVANTVQFAGHIRVEDHANIGGATAVHHFVTIGSFSYVGGMTRVVADVPPYLVVEGNPARIRKVNTTLLKRHDFDDADIERIRRAYRMLYPADAAATNHNANGHANGEHPANGTDTHGGPGKPKLTAAEALEQLDAEFADNPVLKRLLDFTRRRHASPTARHRETLRKDNPLANPVR